MKTVSSLIALFNTVSTANTRLARERVTLEANKRAVRSARAEVAEYVKKGLDAINAQEAPAEAEKAEMIRQREAANARLTELEAAYSTQKYIVKTCRKGLRNALKQARSYANKSARKTIDAALKSL